MQKLGMILILFFMLGNQFGFNYKDEGMLSEVQKNLQYKLDAYLEEYRLEEQDIVYIEIICRKKDKLLFSDLLLDENVSHVEKNIANKDKKNLDIPISIHGESLGKPLALVIDNNIINDIKITIDGKEVNFMDIIKEKCSYLRDKHMDNITTFDASYKFYRIINKNKKHFVLGISITDNQSVDKLIYTMNGVLLNRVKDIVYKNHIKRISGNKIITIENNTITKIEQNIQLKSIQKPKSIYSNIEDVNIGVIDIETYTSKDGTVKVHALGFKSVLDVNPVIYYIDEATRNHEVLILNFLNEMFRSKYDKIRWYCHNLGGYDIVFILKIIYTYNDKVDSKEKDQISYILRDNKVLKCIIKKGGRRIVLIDSYPILPDKLERLGKDYGVDTMKSVFPYKFSLENNLFYIGSTPQYHNYNDISLELYHSLFKLN
jgi:hypothetical protein